MPWDPALYLRFEQYRTRPPQELLARVDVEEPRTVVDLGCGPGNSTMLLVARWPGAQVVGVDSDDAMLAEATRRHPGGTWEKGDVATWEPQSAVDVLFSNATLHWLPDHPRLVRRLFGFVAEGGALAVAMPNNYAAPGHTLIDKVLSEGPWRASGLCLERHQTVCAPDVYYDALAGMASRVDLWETQYHHVLDRADDVVTWMSATGLRPTLEALGEEDRRAFLAAYTDAIRASFGRRADGRVLFAFRRLFFVAKRAPGHSGRKV
jgi:trans-aconitate 2-methyltransferase